MGGGQQEIRQPSCRFTDEEIFEMITKGHITLERVIDVVHTMGGFSDEDMRLIGEYIRAYCYARTKIKETC